MLASGSYDNRIRLWRVSDGFLLQTLDGHTESVDSVAFSPDGGTLASGSFDGSVRLWNVSDGARSEPSMGTRTRSTVLPSRPMEGCRRLAPMTLRSSCGTSATAPCSEPSIDIPNRSTVLPSHRMQACWR